MYGLCVRVTADNILLGRVTIVSLKCHALPTGR